MAERKWGAIGSGATFEALAATIVFFEDPQAALFGRRGPDGGQDARAGNGRMVFQAKHHEDRSPTMAIRDAKKEAEKIGEYRKVGHARYEQWQGVTHWRLVTNVMFNPTDQQTWDNEIVPLFSDIGLKADYWGQEKLNALLDKHPEIHRSFFENETRALLSIPEVLERLLSQEPFLRRDQLGAFCGRTAEINQVNTFLSTEQPFLVLHGPGGIGKTRLLLEAGEKIASEGEWQVLWANVASMQANSSWFEGIVPERPTLLLVDEPDDEKLLRRLSEQIGGKVGRTSQWKVAIAVRSTKDPVLKFLHGPRMKPQVQELEIEPLPKMDAEAMCLQMLKAGKLASRPESTLTEIVSRLAQEFSCYPVWLTLAIHLLEEKGDLNHVPATASDLADEYLNEIKKDQKNPPETIHNLLRWVALIGPINREDNATIDMIGNKAGLANREKTLQCIKDLVDRRALIQRGAFNRLVELKPDVLRDHLLQTWLSVNQGYGKASIVPSNDCLHLIDDLVKQIQIGALTNVHRAILASLAHTEFLLNTAEQAVPLLTAFFEKVETELSTLTASQRLLLVDALEIVGIFQPEEATNIIRLLREKTCDTEQVAGLLSSRNIGQQDVILALAWPLFPAAMGAKTPQVQDSVLRELCELVKVESELAPQLRDGLPNDGERAGLLVQRIIKGGPQFWSGFDDTAKKMGLDLLNKLAGQPPTKSDMALMKALIPPAVALERQQAWTDGNRVHIQTLVIGEDHPGWAARSDLLLKIKELLSNDTTPVDSKVALWDLFSEAHHDINRQNINKEGPGKYNTELLEDMSWTLDLLRQRQNINIKELNAARELWDWHCRFESNEELKQKSQELETFYNSNTLAIEFKPLLNRHEWDQRNTRMSDKASQLAATAKTPTDIAEFLDRAIAFLGDEGKLSELNPLAFALGEHAESHVTVQEFVKNHLTEEKVSPRVDFAHIAAASWIENLRNGDHPENAFLLAKDLVKSCRNDMQSANLLIKVYGRVPRPISWPPYTPDEITFFREQKELFDKSHEKYISFLSAISTTFHHNWPQLKALMETVLHAAIPNGELCFALDRLIDGIYWGLQHQQPPPDDLGEWLLYQILYLPTGNSLGSSAEWRLKEILKKVDRPKAAWLLTTLSFCQPKEDSTTTIAYRAWISEYVQPITATDLNDPDSIQTINKVINFVNDNTKISYYLPKILSDIDPEGLIVPDMVTDRFSKTTDPEIKRRLSRIASSYELNSTAWRTIAKASLLATNHNNLNEKEEIYYALKNTGVQSSVSRLGEVPSVFYDNVDDAIKSLAEETEDIFMPYWQWRLDIAEKALREREEKIKEERGE